jgi:hypothetical protein
MKKQSNFKFSSTDKERWKKCADKVTGGNLTGWMEMHLNKASDALLGKKKKEQLPTP